MKQCGWLLARNECRTSWSWRPGHDVNTILISRWTSMTFVTDTLSRLLYDIFHRHQWTLFPAPSCFDCTVLQSLSVGSWIKKLVNIYCTSAQLDGDTFAGLYWGRRSCQCPTMPTVPMWAEWSIVILQFCCLLCSWYKCHKGILVITVSLSALPEWKKQTIHQINLVEQYLLILFYTYGDAIVQFSLFVLFHNGHQLDTVTLTLSTTTISLTTIN